MKRGKYLTTSALVLCLGAQTLLPGCSLNLVSKISPNPLRYKETIKLRSEVAAELREQGNVKEAWDTETETANILGLIETLKCAYEQHNKGKGNVTSKIIREMYTDLKNYRFEINEEEIKKKEEFLQKFAEEIKRTSKNYLNEGEYWKAFCESLIIEDFEALKKIRKIRLREKRHFGYVGDKMDRIIEKLVPPEDKIKKETLEEKVKK